MRYSGVGQAQRADAITYGESCYSIENSHCGGRLQNEAVHLVCLVDLVYLVCLVCLVEPDRPDRPDESKKQGHFLSSQSSLFRGNGSCWLA
jgi:hypothetical protein